jgi:hypothetical protein
MERGVMVVCLGDAHNVARQKLKTNRAGRKAEVNRNAVSKKEFFTTLSPAETAGEDIL